MCAVNVRAFYYLKNALAHDLLCIGKSASIRILTENLVYLIYYNINKKLNFTFSLKKVVHILLYTRARTDAILCKL